MESTTDLETTIASGTRTRQRHRGRPSAALLATAAALILSLCGAGGLLVANQQERLYGAEADILFTPSPNYSDAASNRLLQTQRIMLTSRAVLEPVAIRFQVSEDTLAQAVKSSIVDTDSFVVRVVVSDPQRERAVALADAVVTGYLVRAATLSGNGAPRPRLLTGASSLSAPLEPRPVRGLAAGLSAGIFVAAGAIWILTRRPLPASPES